MGIKSAFVGLLNGFIPATLRNKPKITRQELVRAQTMVAILGVSILIPMVLLVAYIALQLLTSNDFSRDIIVLMVVVVLLASEHAYFQSYGNLRVTAGIYSVQFLIIAIGAPFFSGGLYSPLTTLLFASPMIAFVTMGYRAALFHITVAFIALVGFLIMHVNGWHLENYGRAENYPYTFTMISGVTLLVFFLFLTVLEELVNGKTDSKK